MYLVTWDIVIAPCKMISPFAFEYNTAHLPELMHFYWEMLIKQLFWMDKFGQILFSIYLFTSMMGVPNFRVRKLLIFIPIWDPSQIIFSEN